MTGRRKAAYYSKKWARIKCYI